MLPQAKATFRVSPEIANSITQTATYTLQSAMNRAYNKRIIFTTESLRRMATLSTTSLPARSTPVLPEAALHVTGAARLVLVINLGSFVVASDADAFRHLRGSEPFAAALRKLRLSAPFGIDEATSTVEHDAYALRIFRSRLLYNHFFPTYRIAWDSTMRERILQLFNVVDRFYNATAIWRAAPWAPR